jgi:hypothetical protein
MDSADYIADLEREVQTLHDRVAELEGELLKVRDELRVAYERKLEEVSVPFDHRPIHVHIVAHHRHVRLGTLLRLMKASRRKRSSARTVPKRKKALTLALKQSNTKQKKRLSIRLHQKNRFGFQS